MRSKDGVQMPKVFRLRQADVIAMLTEIGKPAVEYNARQWTITFKHDVTPHWTPAHQVFQADLDLLLRLAKIHAELNSAYVPAIPIPAAPTQS
jgi:hypothetical protein